MLISFNVYTQNSLIGTFVEGLPALVSSVASVIKELAHGILAQVLISIPLSYLHHNLFACGFVFGFVFDKFVKEIVDKVNRVYNAQRTYLQDVLFFAGGAFVAIQMMPASLLIATAYYSSQWGAMLANKHPHHKKP